MKTLGTIIALVIMIFVAYIYNVLLNARNNARKEYVKLNMLLGNRWNLIPNLTQIIQSYSVVEEKNIEKLSSLINQDFSKFRMEKKLEVDNNIEKVFSKIMKIAKNSPDLQENEQFIYLNNQLSNLKVEIADCKERYDKAVKEYNEQIEVVPNNLVAILFGFNEEKIYDVTSKKKKNI